MSKGKAPTNNTSLTVIQVCNKNLMIGIEEYEEGDLYQPEQNDDYA